MRVGVRLALGASVLALIAAGICVACVGDSSTPSPDTDAGALDSSAGDKDTGSSTPVDSGATSDSGPGIACAELPWPTTGSVGAVPGVSTSFNEFNVTLTGDALSLFLSRGTGAAIGVFESVRDASTSFPMDTQVTDILATTNGAMLPNVSADGLTMYTQYRSNGDGGAVPEGGVGNADAAADLTFNIYVYTRASTLSPWVGPTPVAGVNTAANEQQPFISADGNTLYFVSDRTTPGVLSIYEATKTGNVFGNVKEITGLAAAGASVQFPVMNAASTKLFYAAPTGGQVTGETDIYMVTRPNPNGAFGMPVTVVGLSTQLEDRPGYISPDECRFYFATKSGSAAGDFDIWVSKKK